MKPAATEEKEIVDKIFSSDEFPHYPCPNCGKPGKIYSWGKSSWLSDINYNCIVLCRSGDGFQIDLPDGIPNLDQIKAKNP